MLQEPMDVLRSFEVRKSSKQKKAFRAAVSDYARSLGYSVNIGKGSLGSHNVIIGNISTAKYLVTAHYDTPAYMIVPNLITPCNFWTFMLYQLAVTLLMMIPPAIVGIIVGLVTKDSYTGFLVWYFLFLAMMFLMMLGPANRHTANDNTSGIVTLLEIARSIEGSQRDQIAFILFDLEEMGMVGSSSYRNDHKEETDQQIVLNLDCVGDGDEIILFPMKKVKKDRVLMDTLRKLVRTDAEKTIALHEKGFSVYPSDQSKFPLGVGVAAFKRYKGILYCDRIHTSKDTILDTNNVMFIRNAVVSLLSDVKE